MDYISTPTKHKSSKEANEVENVLLLPAGERSDLDIQFMGRMPSIESRSCDVVFNRIDNYGKYLEENCAESDINLDDFL